MHLCKDYIAMKVWRMPRPNTTSCKLCGCLLGPPRIMAHTTSPIDWDFITIKSIENWVSYARFNQLFPFHNDVFFINCNVYFVIGTPSFHAHFMILPLTNELKCPFSTSIKMPTTHQLQQFKN